jgi:hypothetical protein
MPIWHATVVHFIFGLVNMMQLALSRYSGEWPPVDGIATSQFPLGVAVIVSSEWQVNIEVGDCGTISLGGKGGGCPEFRI